MTKEIRKPYFVEELERKGDKAKAKVLFHFYDALCRKEGEIPALESDELKEQLTKLLHDILVQDEETASKLESLPLDDLREYLRQAVDEALEARLKKVEEKVEEVKKEMHEYYEDIGDGIIGLGKAVGNVSKAVGNVSETLSIAGDNRWNEHRQLYERIDRLGGEVERLKREVEEKEKSIKDHINDWGRDLIRIFRGY